MDAEKTTVFLNRELSWLEFNARVLHEALDERTPLLERFKFLAIVDTNLDEFFMKRVGGLKRQVGAGVRSRSIDGRTPSQQLKEIREVVVGVVREQRRCLLEDLLPAVSAHGVRVLSHAELPEEDRDHVRGFFRRHIFPILTPLAVDSVRHLERVEAGL